MRVLKPEFISSLRALGAAADGLADALMHTEPEVSVRLNTAKGAQIAVPGAERVPWCEHGWYLPEREAFTFDPALHQGLYYVQDASSMALEAVASRISALEGGAPLRWLDACAAPGGKTTTIASALPAGSMLVANEFVAARAAVLEENVAKWGLPTVACVRGDAVRFGRMRDAFDVVSADVPCSGEGMMRKDPEAAAQWSEALVQECAHTQWRIVEALWQAVRPGGYFVYSTCTFNRSENEAIAGRLAAEYGAEGIDIPALDRPEILPGVGTSLPCYRFLPGRVRGEGLFLCVLRKPGSAAPAALRPASKAGKEGDAERCVRSWLGDGYRCTTTPGGDICALPAALAQLMPEARGQIVARVKGCDIVPAQATALSTYLRPEAFPKTDVDYPTAIAYLRREAIAVDAPRGIVLLHYGGRPLGFVKNLGNRANNLYPAPWRILSSHVPEAELSVVSC